MLTGIVVGHCVRPSVCPSVHPEMTLPLQLFKDFSYQPKIWWDDAQYRGADHYINSISIQFNSKKFIVSLSTNEYWTLIQVHNRKHYSGLGTTLRDISKLYFFSGWKHVDCAGTATKKSTVVTSHRGLSHQSFELFNAKQNIPFILNETTGARSSDRAYVPQICLSLFRHNTYDGVHKTKQNV